MLNSSHFYRGILAGLIITTAACASENQTAQNHAGTYSGTRHAVLGSHVPAPDRGVDGANDTTSPGLSQAQYDQLQRQSATSARGGGGF